MPDEPKQNGQSRFTRRGFLKGAGVGAVAAMTESCATDQKPAAEQSAGVPMNQPVSGEIPITLRINGKDRHVTVEPRTTLLSAMRDRLEPALTGPKLVCNAGTCGACTVIMNGKNVYGCSILAVDAVGKRITTVEGLGTPENLSPVQEAFCDKDGMMCGFCTDGFVTSITAYLSHNPKPTLDELKEGLKGNFCRCGTYPRVFESALQASKTMDGVKKTA